MMPTFPRSPWMPRTSGSAVGCAMVRDQNPRPHGRRYVRSALKGRRSGGGWRHVSHGPQTGIRPFGAKRTCATKPRVKDHTWRRANGCGPSAIFELYAAAMTLTREDADDGSD